MNGTHQLALANVLRYAKQVPDTFLSFVLAHPDPSPALLFAALSRPETSDAQAAELTRALQAYPWGRYPVEAYALAVALRQTALKSPQEGVAAARAIITTSPLREAASTCWSTIARNVLTSYWPDHPLVEGMARSNDPDVLAGFVGELREGVDTTLMVEAVVAHDRLWPSEPFNTEAVDAGSRAGTALRLLPATELAVTLERVANPHTIYEVLHPAVADKAPLDALGPKAWSRIVRDGLLPLIRAHAAGRSPERFAVCVENGFPALLGHLPAIPDDVQTDLRTELAAIVDPPGTDAERSATDRLLDALDRRLRGDGPRLPFPADVTWTVLSKSDAEASPIADWVVSNVNDWAILATVMGTLGSDAEVAATVTTAAGLS